MRAFSLTFFCIAVMTSLAAAVQPGVDLRESSWEEFLAASATWPAPKGTIIATYESETQGGGASRAILAFDSHTGTWFRAGVQSVDGVIQNGLQITGEPRREGVRVADPQHPFDWPVVPYCAGTHIPLLRSSPEQVDWVRRGEDGSWHVGFRYARFGYTDRKDSVLVFAEDGTPLVWQIQVPVGDTFEPTVISYDIDPRSPPGFGVNSGIGNQRLSSLEYFPNSRPELFELAAIESVAVDNRIILDATLKRLLLERQPDLAQAGRPSQYAPNNTASRMGTPLVITGIVVVAIGLFALIRTRMAR